MKKHLNFVLFAALFSQVFFVSSPSHHDEDTIDTSQILACSCGKKHK